jgi:hypothetical protein
MGNLEGHVVYFSPGQLASLERAYGPGTIEKAKALAGRIDSLEFKVLGTGPGIKLVDVPSDPRVAELKRLAALWDRMAERSMVGSVEQPGPNGHFSGRMSLHYGAFNEVNPPVMYLTGVSGSTLLVLAGNLTHFLGQEKAEADHNARMVMFEPEVVRAVADAQRRDDPSAEVDRSRDSLGRVSEGDRTPLDAVAGFHYWERMSELEFLFLATVEKQYPGPYDLRARPEREPVSVVIAAPILVARV